MTALVLLFGESAPESYAIENAESWATTVARPLQYSELLLYPLVVTFDRLSRFVNRVSGSETTIETSYVTRVGIREMIETGESVGAIETDEREMLQRIFHFDETIAGFVFNRAGRLVERGATFAFDGAELTVEAVDDTRIRRVRIDENRTDGESANGERSPGVARACGELTGSLRARSQRVVAVSRREGKACRAVGPSLPRGSLRSPLAL